MRHFSLPLFGALLFSLAGCDAVAPSGSDATAGTLDFVMPLAPLASFNAAGSAPDFALLHVYGDSQAAGRADATTSCDLRPDAGTKGYVFRVATKSFAPICDPSLDEQYNSSLVPALVDAFYDRTGVTPLVIINTIKGSPLAPEAASSARPDMYWYAGDRQTPRGEAVNRTVTIFQQARRAAAQQFPGASVFNLAGVLSVGGIDVRKNIEDPSFTATGQFGPRLVVQEAIVNRVGRGFQLFYLELGESPGNDAFNAGVPPFGAELEAIVPKERVVSYTDSVGTWHSTSGFPLGREYWFADEQGHLGSLGLNYLGEVLANQIVIPWAPAPPVSKN